MKRALVFGGTGPIGDAVIKRLLAEGWRVQAMSRHQQPGTDGVVWLQGEFSALPEFSGPYEAIISCGPLDLFSHWHATSPLTRTRVVAFGSTSLETKQDSGDPAERGLAQRLQEAETRIFGTCATAGGSAVLLRPTLVYGSGRDASLSKVAAMASRSGFFVLPRSADGLRQPVHVDDLAQAACSAANGRGQMQAYALPGGETLPYREMIARTLAALPARPRLVELPGPLFRMAVGAARLAGKLKGLPGGAVDRMREDLVFDMAPARRDLGFDPRPFRPNAGMFGID